MQIISGIPVQVWLGKMLLRASQGDLNSADWTLNSWQWLVSASPPCDRVWSGSVLTQGSGFCDACVTLVIVMPLAGLRAAQGQARVTGNPVTEILRALPTPATMRSWCTVICAGSCSDNWDWSGSYLHRGVIFSFISIVHI